MSQVRFSLFLFALSVFSFPPVDSLHSSQAASVAILPSALLVERFSLGVWWAELKEMARCPQRVHSSRWPPSAAVRHRAIARSTLTCFQVIHLRLRSMNAFPAACTRSATSSGGRLIYPSCGDLSLSFRESSGLAVAFRRSSETWR